MKKYAVRMRFSNLKMDDGTWKKTPNHHTAFVIAEDEHDAESQVSVTCLYEEEADGYIYSIEELN